jgi:anti-anti-sigma factor
VDASEVSEAGGSKSALAVTFPDGDRLAVLCGELDVATVPTLEAAFELVSPGAAMVLDLSQVTFLDSSGLTGLVRLYHRLGGDRDSVVLRNPTPNVQQVLAITALDTVFRIDVSS